jgi:antitoxin CcdA
MDLDPVPRSNQRSSESSSRPGRGVTVRKPTNLTLAVDLVAEARELGINVSQAAEMGIATAAARLRQERWLAENAGALESSNAYVEEHGLPLARYRSF